MSGSKFEADLISLQNNLNITKGEVYEFENGKKKSGAISRKALLNMVKIAKQMRMEIQDIKKALPTHRRLMSPETKTKMAAARAARRASKIKATIVAKV